MSFFLSDRPLTRARAMTCAMTNQLGLPGLGSLMGKRWIAGSGQLVLCGAGCVLVLVWFLKIIFRYYGMMFPGQDQPTQPNSVGWIGAAGGILLVVSWLWSGVTSFSLLREASKGGMRPLENLAKPPPLKFDDARIFLALASVPDWNLKDAVISRTFQFKDFPAAIKFVEAVAQLAEEEWHHPDIDIRWNKVTLALTTHDAGGLTEKDFALAKKFDALSLR
jgi:4a-hydroxytetrahydrobiopterin dehydratase